MLARRRSTAASRMLQGVVRVANLARRKEPEHQRDQDRYAERGREHRRVERDVVAPGQARRHEREEQSQPAGSQAGTEDAGGHRDDHALDEELLRQSAARRAERCSHGDLARPCGQPG